MKIVVLGLGVAAAAVWSGLAFVAHLLIDVVGGYGARNADILPLPPDFIVAVSDILALLTGVGGPVIVTIWAIGVGLIAIVTLIGMVVAGRLGRRDKAMRAPDPRFPHFDRPRHAGGYGDDRTIGGAIGRALKRRNLLG